MKKREKVNTRYRGIPCWYNEKDESIKGKNLFYDFIIDILMWIDVNINGIDEFPLWIEVEKSEQEKLNDYFRKLHQKNFWTHFILILMLVAYAIFHFLMVYKK